MLYASLHFSGLALAERRFARLREPATATVYYLDSGISDKNWRGFLVVGKA